MATAVFTPEASERPCSTLEMRHFTSVSARALLIPTAQWHYSAHTEPRDRRPGASWLARALRGIDVLNRRFLSSRSFQQLVEGWGSEPTETLAGGCLQLLGTVSTMPLTVQLLRVGRIDETHRGPCSAADVRVAPPSPIYCIQFCSQPNGLISTQWTRCEYMESQINSPTVGSHTVC